jgi:hypothetical protein
MRKWVSLDKVSELSRQRILDANDLLDAMDEAEEDRQEEPKKRDR